MVSDIKQLIDTIEDEVYTVLKESSVKSFNVMKEYQQFDEVSLRKVDVNILITPSIYENHYEMSHRIGNIVRNTYRIDVMVFISLSALAKNRFLLHTIVEYILERLVGKDLGRFHIQTQKLYQESFPRNNEFFMTAITFTYNYDEIGAVT